MRSRKTSDTNVLSFGVNTCKKKDRANFEQRASRKKQCNFDSGWLERQQCYLIALLNLVNLRDLFGVGTKLKKQKYSRTTSESVPMLQPEHVFCQQNGPERGQVLVSE